MASIELGHIDGIGNLITVMFVDRMGTGDNRIYPGPTQPQMPLGQGHARPQAGRREVDAAPQRKTHFPSICLLQ
jgi:hypothetical protein